MALGKKESLNNIPDNVTLLFMNGVSGEGAKRGRKGWGFTLGEISGAFAGTSLSEPQWNPLKPAHGWRSSNFKIKITCKIEHGKVEC